jgi:hypothetical protein
MASMPGLPYPDWTNENYSTIFMEYILYLDWRSLPMPQMDSEQDRLKKLRDRQLADRNPQVKQRQLQQAYSRKVKTRSGRNLNLLKMWSDLPHSFRSPFYGLLLGLITLWLVPQFWISTYAVPAALLAMLVFILVGFLIGHVLDIRDNLRDLTR